MSQPVLVIMAAGIGSRYGGLKQIDPVGPDGQIILDYSIFDAHQAGFRRAVFVIRPELRESFEQTVGERAARLMHVQYVYQTTDYLPEGVSIPEGREKPLGTGHAVWCAAEAVGGDPFAVINADDFYGADAFRRIYDHLIYAHDDALSRFALVGYRVENTLSESGTVSRGVCAADEENMLTSIVERTAIARSADGVIRDGTLELPEGTPVSMNLWGFTPSFMPALTEILRNFMQNELPENPLKGELYLPFAVDTLLRAGKARVHLLKTDSRWFGVTYQEDKPVVVRAITEMTEAGEYPADF